MTKKTLLEKIENKEKVILYHGSRGGTEGDIAPVSRAGCDFGKGFYIGRKRERIRIFYGKRRTGRCYPVLIMKSAKRREMCMNI